MKEGEKDEMGKRWRKEKIGLIHLDKTIAISSGKEIHETYYRM